MGEPNIIENFFGVYLLYCKNPKYLGRTYIGYTVDPNRRIKQHNKGAHAGGARRTSKRGPWTMVMIIHGFPNEIAALRFEWAWQHPKISRRLNKVPRKKPREKVFNYCLRILGEMLRVGPWNRLPLTVRWLDAEFKQDFAIDKPPPIHMPIVQGTVISKKIGKTKSKSNKKAENLVNDDQNDSLVSDNAICDICKEIIYCKEKEKMLECLNQECTLKTHVICLSKVFLRVGDYIPVDGDCPKCSGNFLWGDLIRKMKGCYRNVEMQINTIQIDEELSDLDD